MIGRSGERGSGISMLAARHDDDEDGELFEIEQFDHSTSCKQRMIFN